MDNQKRYVRLVMASLHWPTGANPATWPLPLTQEGLAQAAKEPVPQPMPSNPNKRMAEEVKGAVSAAPASAGMLSHSPTVMHPCNCCRFGGMALKSHMGICVRGMQCDTVLRKASCRGHPQFR